jgi:type II secretory pathway pseudopilin PulG
VALSTFALLFSLVSPSLASADNKNSNSPTQAEAIKDFKSAIEKFKQDQIKFLEDLKDYDAARRAINRAFKESVDKALSDAKSLSAPGQTQLQKRQSAVAKQSAVIAATAIRDAAIEALGPAPVAPTPPAKMSRMEKSKKSASPTPSAN